MSQTETSGGAEQPAGPLAAHHVYDLGDVVLQSGQTLRDAKLAYQTYGTLNDDRSNAIVYPTWYPAATGRTSG